MNSNRYSNSRRQSSRDSIERRMDQWVETGRQFVDGVAGNRPGQRRKDQRYGLNDMGRWVGEKIDWLMEDEEDWPNPVQPVQDSQEGSLVGKKPLTAISLRAPKALSSSSQFKKDSDVSEDWLDEKIFKIDRWERDEQSQKVKLTDKKGFVETSLSKNNENLRPLPRSSRRKLN